jgi:hypothetical protein
VNQDYKGCLLVSASSQLPDIGMKGHVLHWRLQVVQVVLVEWLPKHTWQMNSYRPARVHEAQESYHKEEQTRAHRDSEGDRAEFSLVQGQNQGFFSGSKLSFQD